MNLKEVVKVQKPLSSNNADPPWLIYDQGKKKVESRAAALIGREVKAATGNDPKAYFEAEWSAEEGWKIGDRVLDQKW
jgi:hypothetical protein